MPIPTAAEEYRRQAKLNEARNVIGDVRDGLYWFVGRTVREAAERVYDEMTVLINERNESAYRMDSLRLQNSRLTEELARALQDKATLEEQLEKAETDACAYANEVSVKEQLIKSQDKLLDEYSDRFKDQTVLQAKAHNLEQEKQALQVKLAKVATEKVALERDLRESRDARDTEAEAIQKLSDLNQRRFEVLAAIKTLADEVI